MRGDSEQQHFPLRFKDIFNRNRSVDKLTDLSLQNFDLDYNDLVTFLRRLPKGMERLSLYNINLHTGSWREALDALREKKPTVVSLKDPGGAECEDMTKEEYSQLFQADTWGYRTEAEAYILGIMPRSPFEVP